MKAVYTSSMSASIRVTGPITSVQEGVTPQKGERSNTLTRPFDTLTPPYNWVGFEFDFRVQWMSDPMQYNLLCIFRGTSQVDTNIYCSQLTSSFYPRRLICLRFSASNECKSECVQKKAS